jgi:uncharacterized protein (DUF3820 family)
MIDLDAPETCLPFGVHAGKALARVPRNYRIWLLTQGLAKHPALRMELRRQVIDMLEVEQRADKLAQYHAGIEELDRMADEDLC